MQETIRITFYAYKGGTGRTLALTNVARYLVERKGFRVGIVDMDFESPGLPHEPISDVLDGIRSEDKLAAIKKFHETLENKDGFLELFNKIDGQQLDLETIHNMVKGATTSFRAQSGGSLHFIQCGQNSSSPDEKYSKELLKFNRIVSKEGDHSEEAAASNTEQILKAFSDLHHLDYIFMDARTGNGEFNAINTIRAPDALVLFAGLNLQSYTGATKILLKQTKDRVPDGVYAPSSGQSPVFLVASHIPTGGSDRFEQRLDSIKKELKSICKNRKELLKKEGSEETKPCQFRFTLPSEPSFFLPYNDIAAYGECYFVDRYPNSFLAHEYINIAKGIEGLHLPRKRAVLFDESLGNQEDVPPRLSQTISIAVEDINLARFQNLLGNDFTTSPFKCGSDEAYQRGSYTNGNNELDLHFIPIDSPIAPWNYPESVGTSLSVCGSSNPQEASNGDDEVVAFDIVALPHSCVPGITDNHTQQKFYNLRETHRIEGTLKRLPLLSGAYMDEWFPGWRKWCFSGDKQIGIPFSINVPLLFVNGTWAGQSLPKDKSVFEAIEAKISDYNKIPLPSNWDGYLQFISKKPTEGSPQIETPFGHATTDDAYFYEWTAIARSLGALEMEMHEGRVRGAVCFNCEASKEAMTIYLKILDVISFAVDESEQNVKLIDALDDFGLGKSGTLFGFTDSFLFKNLNIFESEQGNGDTFPFMHILRKPSENKRHDAHPNIDVRIRKLPNSALYQANPLVEGWVLAFPKKGSQGNPSEDALKFANWLLSPSIQRKMLREGFPTSSLKLQEEQIKICGSQLTSIRSIQEQLWDSKNVAVLESYRVFLEILSDATKSNALASGFSKEIGQAVREFVKGAQEYSRNKGKDFKGWEDYVEDKIEGWHASLNTKISNFD